MAERTVVVDLELEQPMPEALGDDQRCAAGGDREPIGVVEPAGDLVRGAVGREEEDRGVDRVRDPGRVRHALVRQVHPVVLVDHDVTEIVGGQRRDVTKVADRTVRDPPDHARVQGGDEDRTIGRETHADRTRGQVRHSADGTIDVDAFDGVVVDVR